jgi:uncharacterized membrane protein
MKRLYDLANLALLVLTGLFIRSSYALLPDHIPMHFDLAGRPDRWGGRGSLVILFILPLVMTAVFYLLIWSIAKLGANPRGLNMPHKEEFLRLPAEKKDVYWSLFREFFAGLAVAINLLFYFIIRGTVRIATGGTSRLLFGSIIPAFALLVLVLIYYFWRLFTLPGKLIQGEM